MGQIVPDMQAPRQFNQPLGQCRSGFERAGKLLSQQKRIVKALLYDGGKQVISRRKISIKRRVPDPGTHGNAVEGRQYALRFKGLPGGSKNRLPIPQSIGPGPADPGRSYGEAILCRHMRHLLLLD